MHSLSISINEKESKTQNFLSIILFDHLFWALASFEKKNEVRLSKGLAKISTIFIIFCALMGVSRRGFARKKGAQSVEIWVVQKSQVQSVEIHRKLQFFSFHATGIQHCVDWHQVNCIIVSLMHLYTMDIVYLLLRIFQLSSYFEIINHFEFRTHHRIGLCIFSLNSFAFPVIFANNCTLKCVC